MERNAVLLLPKSPLGIVKFAMLSSSLCGFSAIAFAADTSSEDDTYRINTITVHGQAAPDDVDTTVVKELWVGGKVATRVLDTPALVSVITEKEIAQRDAATTEEVLQYSPGILTDYYGSDDRNDYFQIRGYQATTYRDGMTLGSMRGVREDPYAYERIEVIRGANSTLFGPADPGGSVNFVTKRPRFERFGRTFATYGSFDNKEMGVDLGDTLNSDENLAYRFTAKIKDSDLEYDYSRDNSQLLVGGITWRPTLDTTATLLVDYLGRDSTPNSGGYPTDQEYDRSNFYGEPDYNFHDVDRTNITLQVEHYLSYGLKLSGNLRYSDLTDNFGYIYLNSGSVSSDATRYYFGTDTSSKELIGNTILQYDTSFNNIDSNSLFGLEYRDASSLASTVWGNTTDINIANPVYSGAPTISNIYSASDTDYTTISAFLQQNVSFSDRVILTVGIRHDFIELDEDATTRNSDNVSYTDSIGHDTFSETSVRAALTYKVTDEWSTYISQVESVAPPSIGVKPERGDQLELGAKFSPRQLNALFSAAIYDLTKKDVTMTVMEGGTPTPRTMGETRVRGFDFEAKVDVTDDFNVTGGYSYMKTKVVEGTTWNGSTYTALNGNEFIAAPNHSASLWGQYTLPGQNAQIGLGARYIGSYYFNALNTSKSEAATLIDAAFTYRLSKASDISVNVHNLTDKQYVVGSGTADYYNPGRTINASVSYNW